MRGPRIIFKDDRDSSIGRGCVLYGAHFRPEVICIVKAVVDTVSEAYPGLAGITFSEGHRHIRDTRDLHEECRALDFSRHSTHGDGSTVSFSESQLHQLAIGISERLGLDYFVLVHGEGANMHIHIELDP